MRVSSKVGMTPMSSVKEKFIILWYLIAILVSSYPVGNHFYGLSMMVIFFHVIWDGLLKHVIVYLNYKQTIRRSRKQKLQTGNAIDIQLPGYGSLGTLLIVCLFNCFGLFSAGASVLWYLRHGDRIY